MACFSVLSPSEVHVMRVCRTGLTCRGLQLREFERPLVAALFIEGIARAEMWELPAIDRLAHCPEKLSPAIRASSAVAEQLPKSCRKVSPEPAFDPHSAQLGRHWSTSGRFGRVGPTCANSGRTRTIMAKSRTRGIFGQVIADVDRHRPKNGPHAAQLGQIGTTSAPAWPNLANRATPDHGVGRTRVERGRSRSKSVWQEV